MALKNCLNFPIRKNYQVIFAFFFRYWDRQNFYTDLELINIEDHNDLEIDNTILYLNKRKLKKFHRIIIFSKKNGWYNKKILNDFVNKF